MPTLPCSRDRVTGSRFTLMSEAITTATKQTKYSIYEMTVFKALHTRQRRRVIPKSWHINRVIPMTAQLTALREFPGCSAEKGNPGEPSGLPDLKRCS